MAHVPTTPYPLRWLALTVVLAAEIMDLLDASVVGIAAPSIRADLGGDTAVIQWIGAAYTLAFAVGLITGGRLGDLYGRRRMFLTGLVGFVAASALCGIAVSPEMLVTSRVAQGLFGAVLIPQGFGIVKSCFPPKEIGAAFGAFGPAMGLAAVAGPIVAGALIAWDLGGAGWRTIFLINVPIGLACLALAVRVLPESRAEKAPRPDPLGMLLVSAGLLLLVFPLVEGRELGWPVWTVVMMVASVPVLGLFALHQTRRHAAGRAPLVEPALFRERAFSGGLVVSLFFFAGMTGMVLGLGLYLQLGLGYTPLQAGLTQAPWALGTAIGATVSGAMGLGRRVGRPVMQVGAVVMAGGIVVMLPALGADPASVGWLLVPGMLVCGAGMGLMITLLFDIILAGVSLPMVGSASGVLNADQQLASAAGIAILGTLFFTRFDAGDPAGAVWTVLVVAAAMILVSGALTALLPRVARAEDPVAA